MNVPTFDELYQAFRAEVEGRNANLDDWNGGSDLDALGGGAAVLTDEFIRWGWEQFGNQFMDIAEDDALDALVLDRFKLSRHAAVASVGTLAFTRGTSTGTITIPAGTVVEGTGADGETVQVATDADVQLVSGASTVDAAATCTVVGRSGNVADSALDTVPTPLVAAPDLTVTNAGRFSGGGAEETNDQLRSRARRYFQTLRKGTIEALEAGALEVAGVAYVSVSEANILPANGGYTEVFIADQDGYANNAMAALVLAELDAWKAAGVWVQVTPAVREETSLQLTIYVDQDADQSTILADSTTAVLAYTDSLVPGATLYLSRVSHEAFSVSDDVLDTVVDSPGANVVPSATQNILRVPTADLVVSVQEL